jgi:tRNA-intron endonuclease, archaea type
MKEDVNSTMQFTFSKRITVPKDDATKILEGGFGTVLPSGNVQLSVLEAAFLHQKGTITLTDAKKKPLTHTQVEKRAEKEEPNFWIRFRVFSDLRKRGYIVKTALKYGADFRVYDRGVKPGEDHAKWIIFPVHEGEVFNWHEFAAKNRVAHGVNKRLMLGIVDDEGEVIYYEVRWMRP